MQEWFSEKLFQEEALSSLVINYEDIAKRSCDDDMSVVFQKITECFKYCLKSFNNNEIITENKNISINVKDRLAPDFVVYAPETQSIVIIELKNIKDPTREARTELGAYAAEMKTFLPFLSEGGDHQCDCF